MRENGSRHIECGAIDERNFYLEDLWIHDSSDKNKAYLLTPFFDNTSLGRQLCHDHLECFNAEDDIDMKKRCINNVISSFDAKEGGT